MNLNEEFCKVLVEARQATQFVLSVFMSHSVNAFNIRLLVSSYTGFDDIVRHLVYETHF